MFLVAVTAVALGVATAVWRYRTLPATLWRYWTTVSMLQGEPSLLLHYSVGLVLATVALALVAIGSIVLAVRLWTVLRVSSSGSSHTRSGQ
jgi:hypothetical protein